MNWLVLAVVLFGQTSNPWDGTWKWATHEERQAYIDQFTAEGNVIADENCGKPYFGTYCKLADGTYGFVSR